MPDTIRISKTMWADAQRSPTHQNLPSGLPIILANGDRVVVYDDDLPGEPIIGELKYDVRTRRSPSGETDRLVLLAA